MSKKRRSKVSDSSAKPIAIKPKTVTLHAFSIKNNTLSKPSSMLYSRLLAKLESSESCKDRCMILNEKDENKERDLISSYTLTKAINAIFGTIMRIAESKDLPNVPDELFHQKLISIDDLNENLVGNICRHHYYFLLEDNYIITYFAGYRTIKNLQTYIGWLVGDELIEFTPVVAAPPDMKLSDLKQIRILDPISVKETDNASTENNSDNREISTVSNKTFHLNSTVLSCIKKIINLNDVTTLKEEELEQIISAELSIKFKKPKKMTEEDYKRILGATLKPMADLDSAVFSTQNSKKIVTGKDLLKTKEVCIDLTENGKVSEQALHQEMSKFLNELKENEKIYS